VDESTLAQDLQGLVDKEGDHDLSFYIKGHDWQPVYAHKALILHRLRNENLIINGGKTQVHKATPAFLHKVATARYGEKIHLDNVSDRQSFIKLLQYLYSGQFPTKLTLSAFTRIADIARTLGLSTLFEKLKRLLQTARSKLQEDIIFKH